MSKAESPYWTWTLGLLTAASTCLVAVGSEAAGECEDDCGAAMPSSDSAPVQCGEMLVAASPQVRLLPDSTPSGGEADSPLVLEASAGIHRHASARSQLMIEPGPPLYLVAPSHSPPEPFVSAARSELG